MAFTTLIDPTTLARELGNPDFVVVDCSFKLDDPRWGAAQYAQGHIPGAVHADLDRDLSGEKTGVNGRHPLPSPQAVMDTFGRLGIAAGVQAVLYDQDSGMFASRLWWLLRWLGHEAAAVLDGGLAAWRGAGFPTATGHEVRAPRRFEGAPRPEMIASIDEVQKLLGHGEYRLLDARAPDRFSGASEPIDRRAGHIPGAVNYYWQSNLDGAFRVRSRETLRRQILEALGGVRADRAVCYCGSGVSACHNLLAMEHAGLTGARLYPGSWSEWSTDLSRPIAADP